MNKVYPVKSGFRKNPESLIPGGTKVRIQREGEPLYEYDKIKMPNAYIDAAFRKEGHNIIRVEVLREGEWRLVYLESQK